MGAVVAVSGDHLLVAGGLDRVGKPHNQVLKVEVCFARAFVSCRAQQRAPHIRCHASPYAVRIRDTPRGSLQRLQDDPDCAQACRNFECLSMRS